MFTSGSTGKPKGVLISHYNLSFFLLIGLKRLLKLIKIQKCQI